MRYLSVCSGIEAATVAWHPLGWEPVAFSEVDAFPSAVLKHHYPHVPNWGDMTKFQEWPDAAIDVLVGGTPCQSFSVAGLRQGLNDPRGNLMLSYIGVLDRYRPRYFVWENVPGVLSDDTQALQQLLDAVQELGYVVDVDVLDAQHHGLAQRRERVFVCGHLASDIAQQRTISSALTVLHCLTESLLLTSVVLSDRFRPDSSGWMFDATEPRLSLQQRMQLFALDSAEAASILDEHLAVLQQWCERERGGLDSVPGSGQSENFRGYKVTRLDRRDGKVRRVPEHRAVMEAELGRELTDDERVHHINCRKRDNRPANLHVCPTMSAHSTAHHSLNVIVAELLERGVIEFDRAAGFIDYATAESNCLFTDVEWVQPWADFVQQAAPAAVALGNLRVASFGSLLPISESLSGHPAPRREAGQVAPTLSSSGAGTSRTGNSRTEAEFLIAPTVPARRTGGGGLGTDFDCDGGLIHCVETAPTLNAHFGDKWGLEDQHALNGAGLFIAHSLRADGFDASEDGTGRGTPLVPISFRTNQTGAQGPIHSIDLTDTLAQDHPPAVAHAFDAQQSDVLQYGDQAGPLDTDGHSIAVGWLPQRVRIHDADGVAPTLASEEGRGHGVPTIAFTQNQRDEVRLMDVAGALASEPGMKQQTYTMQHMAVRRLTPVECARLQGFSDSYLDILYRGKPAADGPKYKALGNSMAVPVMAWIGKRIQMVEDLTKESAV